MGTLRYEWTGGHLPSRRLAPDIAMMQGSDSDEESIISTGQHAVSASGSKHAGTRLCCTMSSAVYVSEAHEYYSTTDRLQDSCDRSHITTRKVRRRDVSSRASAPHPSCRTTHAFSTSPRFLDQPCQRHIPPTFRAIKDTDTAILTSLAARESRFLNRFTSSTGQSFTHIGSVTVFALRYTTARSSTWSRRMRCLIPKTAEESFEVQVCSQRPEAEGSRILLASPGPHPRITKGCAKGGSGSRQSDDGASYYESRDLALVRCVWFCVRLIRLSNGYIFVQKLFLLLLAPQGRLPDCDVMQRRCSSASSARRMQHCRRRTTFAHKYTSRRLVTAERPRPYGCGILTPSERPTTSPPPHWTFAYPPVLCCFTWVSCLARRRAGSPGAIISFL